LMNVSFFIYSFDGDTFCGSLLFTPKFLYSTRRYLCVIPLGGRFDICLLYLVDGIGLLLVC
jgi:hypothetical protein